MINEYINWFKKEITIKKLDTYAEISTPFLDKNNDNVMVYVCVKNDIVRISDDSYYINNLLTHGVNLSNKRRELIKIICSQYAVQVEENETYVVCSKKDYPRYMHLMIQAILAVDDLYNVSTSRVANFFYDDVIAFFDKEEVFYTENVSFTGKSMYTHKYDFLFQRSKTKPERLCKLINNATKTNMANVIFLWEDTRAVRKADSKLFVLINDQNKIDKGVIDSFNAYEINTFKWSDINNCISEFA